MGARMSQADEEKIQKIQKHLETEKQALEKEQEENQKRKVELQKKYSTIEKLHHVEQFKKLKDKIDLMVNNYNNKKYAIPEHLCDLMCFIHMVDEGKFNWLKDADYVALNIITHKWGEMQYIFNEKPDDPHRAFLRQTIQEAADRLAVVSLYRFPYY